ncbi:hypothetical protein V6N11_025640 [Hibiscus sabdariffa]|uniref:Uncharacterized protein n=1 Tax=Hibiscus sabdariffa TaxID=183260 RepID=A0ABR2STA0_9ROSI
MLRNVDEDSRAASRNSSLYQEMLTRIHELLNSLLCQEMLRNVDEDLRAASRNASLYQEMLRNVDEDSRAASRNSLLYQEMLVEFTSCKPKLFAPPENVKNVGRIC